MPVGGNPVKVSAAGEAAGFGEQRPPFGGVGDRERGPLAEGAAVGREREGLAGGGQLADPVGGKLDDEVPGGPFDAGEEGAVRAGRGTPSWCSS